jgi:hypothetical protein
LVLFVGWLQWFQIEKRYGALKAYKTLYEKCEAKLATQPDAENSLHDTASLRLACSWLQYGHSALVCALEGLKYDEETVNQLIEIGFPTHQDKENASYKASYTGLQLLKSATELCSDVEKMLEQEFEIWLALIRNNHDDSKTVVRPICR